MYCCYFMLEQIARQLEYSKEENESDEMEIEDGKEEKQGKAKSVKKKNSIKTPTLSKKEEGK